MYKKYWNSSEFRMNIQQIADEITNQSELMLRPGCPPNEYKRRQKIIGLLKLLGRELRVDEIMYHVALGTTMAPPNYFDFE